MAQALAARITRKSEECKQAYPRKLILGSSLSPPCVWMQQGATAARVLLCARVLDDDGGDRRPPSSSFVCDEWDRGLGHALATIVFSRKPS